MDRNFESVDLLLVNATAANTRTSFDLNFFAALKCVRGMLKYDKSVWDVLLYVDMLYNLQRTNLLCSSMITLTYMTWCIR